MCEHSFRVARYLMRRLEERLNMNISTHTKKVLFLSDLDGTWLSKNPANRRALDEGVQELRDEYAAKGVDLEFGYVTARPPERVAQENLPSPDWTITFNGGRIDKGTGFTVNDKGERVKAEAYANWDEFNDISHFDSSKAVEGAKEVLASGKFGAMTLNTIGEVVENPAADDCKFATHLCFPLSNVSLNDAERTDDDHNGTPDILQPSMFKAPEQLLEFSTELNLQMKNSGVEYEISPAYLFQGKPYAMLDIASPLANKGDAVGYLRDEQGVTHDHLIVAGDGGNDISMMRDSSGRDDGRRAIVVGPDAGLRHAAAGLSNVILQDPDEDCSLGVLDGLRRHLEAIAAE